MSGSAFWILAAEVASEAQRDSNKEGRFMPSRGAVLACVLASTAGCYKATFISDPNAVRGAEREKWTNFFLFGLVGDETLDVNQFCPDGRVAELQTGGNFLTGLVSALTIGIYTPRRAI